MTSGCKFSLTLILLCTGCLSDVFGQVAYTFSEGRIVTAQFVLNELLAEPELYLKGARRAVAGTWKTHDDTLIFKPVTGLSHQTKYQLNDGAITLITFETPPFAGNVPVVQTVLPGINEIPANFLKFQVVFSKPMMSGRSMEFIQLYNDEEGISDPLALLEVSTELWNRDNDTLTVWLNPGRIKRDLIPNRKFGNPMTEGSRYRIEISSGWPDMTGARTETSYTWKFSAAPYDRERPNPDAWRISAPKAGTKLPVVLVFDESMDARTSLAYIRIYKAGTDNELPGMYELSEDQKILRYKPVNNWHKGLYNIIIEPEVEDLAGNRPGRLFDEHIPESSSEPEKAYNLSFVVE